MSDELSEWLTKEINQHGWSHNELARRAGVSQFAVSSVLSGKRNAGADFCIKVAQALEVPPEMLLRLAGILPPPPPPDDDPNLAESWDILRNLPPGKRKEALHYLRYLHQTRQEE